MASASDSRMRNGRCWPGKRRRWRKALLELDTIVSPDTLMRRHRRLVAQKWDFSRRRGPGRPGIMRETAELIVRMAQENPGCGYARIQGALANLMISRSKCRYLKGLSRLLILISYQDDTNYGMLRVVSDDRRNSWQDLDR